MHHGIEILCEWYVNFGVFNSGDFKNDVKTDKTALKRDYNKNGTHPSGMWGC